ncbi:polyprenol monophosphomannose synthase [Candidatus Alkanophaga liquidiphilum]|nr:Glycosyltransferase involved in cell wall bisynthesis [Candidatus Alkanophaga liquidiphilum]RLG38358.1 MAG: polyprenol monophosphomannose synthase [Candidatus Alkanophagales archaeon]
MKVSVVVPTYNERENIRILIPKIMRVFEQEGLCGEVIVVDDNSDDGTAAEVRRLSQIYPNVILVERERKLGLGSAYRCGFEVASGDVVFEMDADLSHDPIMIPKFLEKIKSGADVVIGSRLVRGGRVEDWDAFRIILSRGANALARLLLQLDVKDLTSGFRAYKREVLDEIKTNGMNISGGYAFQVEMAYFAKKLGFSVSEIPIRFRDREFGETKLGIKDILEFVRILFKLRLRS